MSANLWFFDKNVDTKNINLGLKDYKKSKKLSWKDFPSSYISAVLLLPDIHFIKFL